MGLSGLERVRVRPRGGVSKVELAVASSLGSGVEAAGSSGSSSSSSYADGATEWVFREDGAEYSEILVDEGGAALVKHTLVVEFPAGEATRRAVDELVAASGFGSGIVAQVTLSSGEKLCVGRSVRFGVKYPLRVAKTEYSSGLTPAHFPAVKVTLESVDADPAAIVG